MRRLTLILQLNPLSTKLGEDQVYISFIITDFGLKECPVNLGATLFLLLHFDVFFYKNLQYFNRDSFMR